MKFARAVLAGNRETTQEEPQALGPARESESYMNDKCYCFGSQALCDSFAHRGLKSPVSPNVFVSDYRCNTYARRQICGGIDPRAAAVKTMK
jgi:hypothetical protein